MGNHIGFLGAVYNATDVPGIIAWDLTKTDYFRPACYPTYLLYNPFGVAKTVQFDAGPAPSDLYDEAGAGFLRRNVSGRQPVTLSPDGVVVLVVTPPNGVLSHEGRKVLLNKVAINYQQPRARDRTGTRL